MKIGIDISQTVYQGTGVAQYLKKFTKNLLKIDKKNEYILFFSSLRGEFKIENPRVEIKNFRLPPVLLDFIWNKLHIAPIEWFIGDIDIFISSDWTQAPTIKAKKATILYDLVVYKYPKETDKKIVETQKRKLEWVKKECDIIFCISESTKKDAMEILKIPDKKLKVIYPGI